MGTENSTSQYKDKTRNVNNNNNRSLFPKDSDTILKSSLGSYNRPEKKNIKYRKGHRYGQKQSTKILKQGTDTDIYTNCTCTKSVPAIYFKFLYAFTITVYC